ncbi:hypothetical protein XENOCAPTIV_030820, partial [Xenoophorus captivus]
MSDLEARVCAILDVMVTATVSEMGKVISSSDPACPNEPPSGTEIKQESSDQKVMQFSVFLESLAQEAVEKICQLFEECSSLLRLEVSQGAEEIEDLRRRLRGVEMDLKLVMEGSAELGGQEEVTQEQSEERQEGEEDCRGSMRDCCLPVFIICQVEPVDPVDGNDPVYTIRPKGLMKPRSRVRGSRESRGQKEQALSCRLCRKTFSKLLQLKAHQAVHGANAEKPFLCSQCGRGFSFQRSLSAHMLIHTGK